MKKNAAISLIIGAVVSIIAFYIAFKNVPVRDLFDYLLSINYFWVFPSMLVGFSSFFFRAFRWQMILAATRRIGFWRLYHPMMIGFMMNSILPGRIGELARPVLLKKNDHVPFSTGLATIAAERAFDVVLLMAIFVVVIASVHIDPNFHLAFAGYELSRETLNAVARGMLIACLVLIAAMMLFTVDASRSAIRRTVLRLPGIFAFNSQRSEKTLKEKIFQPVVRIIDNIAEGLSSVKHPKTIAACFFLSFVVWCMQTLALYIMALGCPGVGLSFLEMFAVMVIICFFIALPSVPGFWGLWEAGGIFALALFGISVKEAAGFILATHAILMIPVIFAGMLSAAVIGVNVLKLSEEKSEP